MGLLALIGSFMGGLRAIKRLWARAGRSSARSIWTETSFSSFAAVAPMAAGLITAPITTRALGAAGRGFVATGLTWTSALAMLFCLSLGQIAVSVASQRGAHQRYGVLAGTLGLLAMAGTCAGWLTLALLWLASGGEVFGDTPPWVMAALSANLPFFLWNYLASGLVQIRGAVRRLAVASLVCTISGVLLTVLLVGILDLGLGGLVIAIGAGNALLAIFQLKIAIEGLVGRLAVDGSLARQLVWGGLRLHPNAIGVFLIAHSDILMLAHYSSPEDVGWYQLAVVLSGILMVVPQAMASSLYSLVARRGAEAAWPQQRRLALHVAVLTVVCAVVALPLAGPIVRVLAGPGFGPTTLMLQILVFAAVSKAVPTVLAPQFVARGLLLRVSIVAIIGGLLNVMLNLWAIPNWGGVGAAATTVIAYGFMLSASLTMSRSFNRPRTSAKPTADGVVPENV